MPDLSVRFVGLTFPNPVLIGSCSLTGEFDKVRAMQDAGAGGIILKLITHALPPDNNYFRAVVSKGGWSVYGDKRLNVEQGMRFVDQCKRALRVPVIANIMGKSAEEESWCETAQKMQEAGADGLELDLSCPNVEYSKQTLAQFAGFAIGRSPDLTARITRCVKQAVTIPVISKLTPETDDLVDVARACMLAGADAVSGINAIIGFPGVDIDRGGKPLYPGVETQPFSACMGAWLKPIAVKHTARICREVPVPFSSVGGIMTWRDAVERLMLGATTVQLCSTVYLNGLERITNIVRQMEKFLVRNRYASVHDVIGLAQQHIDTSRGLVFRDVVWDIA